jgi:hypothetical protein
MSRVHIRFRKEQDLDDSVIYRVDSSDFSDVGNWEPIARITVNKIQSTYKFEPLGCFLNFKVVPPFVYDMSESERSFTLHENYKEFSYGGWTSRMAKMIRPMIANNNFPLEAYGTT